MFNFRKMEAKERSHINILAFTTCYPLLLHVKSLLSWLQRLHSLKMSGFLSSLHLCQSLLSPLFRPPLPVFSALLCAWHGLQRLLYTLRQESLKGQVRHARPAHSIRIPLMPQPRSKTLPAFNRHSLSAAAAACQSLLSPLFRSPLPVILPCFAHGLATKTTLHTSPRITEESSPACEVGT